MLTSTSLPGLKRVPKWLWRWGPENSAHPVVNRPESFLPPDAALRGTRQIRGTGSCPAIYPTPNNPNTGGGSGATYMSLNISGADAANFMTGQFVTPQFVTDQAMAAQYSSYGRTQQSANMQLPGLGLGLPRSSREAQWEAEARHRRPCRRLRQHPLPPRRHRRLHVPPRPRAASIIKPCE
jgi:hypothetical protein